MDVGAVLIKLKENSLEQVKNWQDELKHRQHEAIATLQAEGVFVESWFYVQVEQQDYLIAYMRAEDIPRAQYIRKHSQFPIDQVHKAFKQNWDKVIPASLLVDLERKVPYEN